MERGVRSSLCAEQDMNTESTRLSVNPLRGISVLISEKELILVFIAFRCGSQRV